MYIKKKLLGLFPKKVLATAFLVVFPLGAVFSVETVSTNCGVVTTSIMPSGDLSDSGNANFKSVIGFDYDLRGELSTSPNRLELASAREVGTVWGKTYNANTKKLYVSAFLRRHAPLSPDGLGAIYEIDVSDTTSDTTSDATIGTPTLWMDLNSTTYLGSGATLFPSETPANRGLSTPFAPSHDTWAYTRVAKQGIGALAISDDYSKLYAMDMTNRQLLEIDIASKNVTNRYAVNDPGCAGGSGDIRPFAVNELNGEVYISVTCSGETGQNDNDTNAYVMKLSGSSFVTVVNNDLYRWDSFWTDDLNGGGSCSSPKINSMVPVITNMNLDSNGNMVIGYTSVNGWRWASRNYTPDPACSDLTQWHESKGFVVLATPGGAGWEVTGAEFIDHTSDDPSRHYWNATRAWWGSGSESRKTFTGGMDITDCSGQETLMLNMMDPINYQSSGTRWGITSNGSLEAATNPADTDLATITASTLEQYHGVGDEHWEKSTGLGDIEYLRAGTPACSITASATVSACTNVGSDTDSSNDTYTVTITASGTNASSAFNYASSPAGISGSGINFTASPYTTPAINIESTDSPLTLTVTDSVDNTCSTVITPDITEPVTCSPATPSGSLEISKTVTGKPSPFTSPNYDIVVDCSDDTFDQTISLVDGASQTISGIPENTTCTVTEPSQPAPPAGYSYGAATFVPASASTAPGVTITANTTVSVAVTNPLTQNAVCSISSTVSTQCNNNGTPSDSSDDTFSYTINATGANAGASFSISGDDAQTALAYGTDHTFQPFNISGGDLTLTLTDGSTASCTESPVTVTAPATCSNVTPQVDLELTKTANPTSAVSGDTVVYTLTATNNGPNDATGVEVTDQLPSSVTATGNNNASKGSYTGSIWTIGDLANGDSETLTIEVTIN